MRNTQLYPYRPTSTVSTPSTNAQCNYPYRPSSLLVKDLECKSDLTATSQVQYKPQVPAYAKVNKTKLQTDDKRISRLVANKTKLFEAQEEDSPVVPSKLPIKLTTLCDDDVTPTNETASQSQIPSNGDKSAGHNTKPATSMRPPLKPPRTFAHDTYMQVKLAQNQEEAVDIGDSERQPFYEEIKPNGTIKRKSKKVPQTTHFKQSTAFESVNDELKDKIRTYETIKNKSGTYESLSEFSTDQASNSSRQDRAVSTLLPSSSKPKPPPKPSTRSVFVRQSSLDSSHSQLISDDESYHNQSRVQVLKANIEMPRKIEPVIIRRGIANPSYHYSRKHDCIPIKTVPAKDGSLKRFKSDECIYAEPGMLDMTAVYQDPADWYPPKTRNVMSTIEIDRDGYAMPYNSAARLGVKEQLSEAYSVLRRRQRNNASVPAGTHSTSTDDDSDNEVDMHEHARKIHYLAAIRDPRHSIKASAIYASAMLPQQRGANQLYSYAMIVGLEVVDDTRICSPTVLYTFPHQTIPLSVIASFCFPDAANWRPVSNYSPESYSFVLTGSAGERQYGYCRRFLPPSANKKDRLPEVYCIISNLQSFNFYNNLLIELQKKRDLSLEHAQELLQAAYGRPMPSPGQEAWIKTCGPKAGTVRKQDCVCLRRNSDHRFEKVSVAGLLRHLSHEHLVTIFASILLQRRVIMIARQLGTLTKCIHALISLLYPFSWPHTFIPILPKSLLEVVEAPTPFIIGIMTSDWQHVMDMDTEEVLIVDIDNDSIIRSQGDELRILPKKLQKALMTVLKMKDSGANKQQHVLVAEAFLRMFIETIGHYTEYINRQQNGEQVFQKDMFIKDVSSNSIRLFLEWFTETQLFESFIEEKMKETSEGLFDQRLIEYREEMEQASPSFRKNMKDVGKRVKHFFVESVGEKLKKAFKPSSNVYV